MKNWFGRTDTVLIYPPVDMRYFRAYDGAQIIENVSINKMDMVYKGYYLSFARLTSNKRIDTIIRAFQRMPSEQVVIIYGENDTDKNKLMELAAVDTHRDLIE
jgi:glycosyltransferase involved in cell wall biosynthesis